MVLRRHKALWQALLLLVIVGAILRFSYNYYKETELKLKAANIRHHELMEDRNRMSRDLDGVMESKNNLEFSLRTKVQSFAKIKEEWDNERDKLQNRVNKDKTSFDALDTEYRTLKAKNEDLQTEYDHMKKGFDRLTNDHKKLNAEHQNNFNELKRKDEKIIAALQNQVEHYQQQTNKLETKVEDLKGNLAKYQTAIAKLQQKLSQTEKGKQEQVPEVKNDHRVSNEPAAAKQKSHTRTKRRRIQHSNPTIAVMNKVDRDVTIPVSDNNKALKHKQFLQNLEKLAEASPMKQGRNSKVRIVKENHEVPKVGGYEVNVVQRNLRKDIDDSRRKNNGNEGQKEDQKKNLDDDEKKDESHDNIEVISKNGKEEGNFNLDEQSETKENKEGQVSLSKDENGEIQLKQDKSNANEQMNDDQKSDDEEIALQEGDSEDENEEHEVLDQPENLLKREEEAQEREEVVK
ncbi:glutamic acid-rich protein-like [Dendronephthya gigantea]|uniref:glutamic acid-rich protein-like n=1 Tax=Dendronephthya gigantea TaxID=151771 RepID=UPI0010698DED|nr:glutamic acid-rich protein-like [Dendronephthya gigantea]